MAFCVFTICSRNYLHFARTLMESVREYQPDARRVVALCDRAEGVDADPDEFEIIDMHALGIPDLERMISRYTVLELNTAIKPFVFSHLFSRRDGDDVVYLDPDIRLYRDCAPLFREWEGRTILLTPHVTEPIEDTRHPQELTFLLCGTYNLGFIAIRNNEEGRRMVTWWQGHLRDQCVVDLPHGLFVDQKWANLIPGLFDEVGICRSPGWNVAYWNLHSRTLARGPGGGIEVNGEPLFFFHFSGVDVEGTVFSPHQDRFTLGNLPPEVRELTLAYCERLRKNGAEEFRTIDYAYSRFASGRKIPDFIRRIYRTQPAAARRLGDLTSAEGERQWVAHALEVPPGMEVLNRAACALYELRIDLSDAFPDLMAGNEMPYANWFVDNGANQPDIDEVFVDDVRQRLRGNWSPPEAGGAAAEGQARHSFKVKLYRDIYRVAWRMQGWVTPLTSMAFRRKVHSLLVNLAYNKYDPPSANPFLSPPPLGMNVIGYLQAESGVGRAARLTLAAAEAADLPVATRNFEMGCVSRQEEEIDRSEADLSRYGINLFHINADQIPIVHSHLDPGVFEGRYNIGFWYWEMPEIPDEWMESFQMVDEIWVASTFCQEAIAARSPVPVLKMPPGISVSPDPNLARDAFGLPERDFLFLAMADGLSFFERKNILGTLDAFERAFPPGTEGVKLVIKIINGARAKAGYNLLLQRTANNPSLLVIDRYLTRAETDSLLDLCDAVVSLHRSEGFGLPLAEAMLLGKPALATDWSGNRDFVTPRTAFPVDCRMVALTEDYGPYKAGMHWAEPDLDQAARIMARIFEGGPEVRERARAGQRHVREVHSPSASGERMKRRVAWIRNRSWGAV